MIKSLVTLSIAIILATITIYSAMAVPCSAQSLCYNDKDLPFCSPQDSSCVYKKFSETNGICSFVIEEDADGDGWTDTCDAFVLDESEWVDFDGDEVGNNADCDDLDSLVKICANETTNSLSIEETDTSSEEIRSTNSRNRGGGRNTLTFEEVNKEVKIVEAQQPLEVSDEDEPLKNEEEEKENSVPPKQSDKLEEEVLNFPEEKEEKNNGLSFSLMLGAVFFVLLAALLYLLVKK